MLKQLPIIRHIRYAIALHRYNRWWSNMERYFVAPNPADLEYLEGIWTGKR